MGGRMFPEWMAECAGIPKDFMNLFVEWMGDVINEHNRKEGKTGQNIDDDVIAFLTLK